MISYFLRNASLILYEGCLGMSKFSKILLIKNSNLGNLLLVIIFNLLSTITQTSMNARVSLGDNLSCSILLLT